MSASYYLYLSPWSLIVVIHLLAGPAITKLKYQIGISYIGLFVFIVLAYILFKVALAVEFQHSEYESTVIYLDRTENVDRRLREISRELAERHSMYLLEVEAEPAREVSQFLRATSGWWRMRVSWSIGDPEFGLAYSFDHISLAIYASCSYEGEVDLFSEWETALNASGLRYSYDQKIQTKDRIMSQKCPA